jgi:hypothetical protein
MAEITPEFILAQAAEDCAANWCRGTNEDKATGQHCMLGAINVAAGVPTQFYDWDDLNGSIEDSADGQSLERYTALRDAASKVPENIELRDEALRKLMPVILPGYPVREMGQGELVSHTYHYNDRSDQTSVVWALQKAAGQNVS